MTLIQGLPEAPTSFQAVASGDYKATDPANTDIVVPEDAVGMKVELDVTAASGGGGVTVTIYGYDQGSATWVTLLASAQKTSTGHVTLRVDPRITASANLIAQDGLPGQVRVGCVGGGTRTTLNYSVGVSFHQ